MSMRQIYPICMLAMIACISTSCMTSEGGAFRNTIDADEKKPPAREEPRDIGETPAPPVYTPIPSTENATPAPRPLDNAVYIEPSDLYENQSVYCGTSGLMFCPRPLALPENEMQLSAMFVAHGEFIDGDFYARVPSGLFYRRSIGDSLEIDIMGGAVLTNYYSSPLIASGSVKYEYLDIGEDVALRSALFARASIHLGTGTDTYGNFSGLFFGIPVETKIGLLTFVACPEIAVSPWRVTGTPDWYATAGPFSWLYLRTGLIFELWNVTLATSAVVRTLPFADGFGFDIPVRASAELGFFIPDTILVIHVLATLDYENPQSFFVSAGLGLSTQFGQE